MNRYLVNLIENVTEGY